MLWSVFQHLREDLTRMSHNEVLQMQRQSERCRMEWYKNECEPETRREGLEGYCLEQERCMERDPWREVTAVSVAMKYLVDIINQFVEPLSYKALAFLTAIIVLAFKFMEFTKRQPQILKLELPKKPFHKSQVTRPKMVAN